MQDNPKTCNFYIQKQINMETITLNLYKVSELSGKIQSYVLDKYRDVMTDYQWWDFIYEDAQRIGLEISSFDIYYRTISIEYTENADVVAQNILKDWGEGTELNRLANDFIQHYTKLKEQQTFDEYGYSEQDDDIDDAEKEFLHELGEEFLSILTSDYEWRTSDEAIMEYLEDNQYMFTENGTQIQ